MASSHDKSAAFVNVSASKTTKYVDSDASEKFSSDEGLMARNTGAGISDDSDFDVAPETKTTTTSEDRLR